MWKFIKKLWEKGLSGKTTIICSIVVLLGATAGTIYGIVTSAGDEGLLEGGGHKLKWKRTDFPICCTYDHDGDYERSVYISQSYERARQEINERVGAQLLGACHAWSVSKPMPEHVFGAITLRVGAPSINIDGAGSVTTGSPFDAHPGGSTDIHWDKRDGHIISAAIYIQPNLKEKYTDRVWLHEVLHALGLAHDRLRSSVMYTSLSDRPSRLSIKDVELLQKVYVE